MTPVRMRRPHGKGSEMDSSTAAEREAESIGRELGTAAGSWVVDGNSSTETLRAVIRASEEGEFYTDIVPEASGPLSGEWADGYSLGRFSDDIGVDQDSDEFGDLCSILEEAYWSALEDEAVRSARGMLPDDTARVCRVCGEQESANPAFAGTHRYGPVSHGPFIPRDEIGRWYR
jgi:hypothetical protein